MVFSECLQGYSNARDVAIGGAHVEDQAVPCTPTLFWPGIRWVETYSELPNGLKLPYVATVLVDKNPDQSTHTCCTGLVVLSKEQTPHHGNEYYSIPAGGIKQGETPAETALREIIEETGFQNIFELKPMGILVVPERIGYWPQHGTWVFSAESAGSTSSPNEIIRMGPGNFLDVLTLIGSLDNLVEQAQQQIAYSWQRESSWGQSTDYTIRDGYLVREREYH